MNKVFSLFLLSGVLFANNLSDELLKHWKKQDEFLEIKSLSFNPNINNCKIITYPNLSKQGFFKANCNDKDMQISFKLQALTKVYILKKDVLKDEEIGLFDLKSEKIDFSKLPYNALRTLDNSIKFKSKVRAGSIIKTSMLMPNYLINKDDSVVGILDDGDLSVFVDLIALQSGVKGQRIRLKNTQGHNLTGEIINEKQVLIK
ncbi:MULTISPECIES: flagellar basal body P-ring formation chaperone FlgA [unclassified Campylobacter]|uniref:flagellar basal body P-ring formation chaperone FlgA n=1 Tax=unclassified Campylobacter TaxID=2593542 RepID=UPI001D91F9FF|nr:flagellar basal body P-ring formation protein FlgA [Campylobacter sp. RM9331]MBZ8005238.1 flagellar basal body P-ring formation protein FlgA [Campylobacter sp. RM9332]